MIWSALLNGSFAKHFDDFAIIRLEDYNLNLWPILMQT